jgi:hypothetical protein
MDTTEVISGVYGSPFSPASVIAASAGRARRPIYLTRDAARIPLLGKSGRERRPVAGPRVRREKSWRRSSWKGLATNSHSAAS